MLKSEHYRITGANVTAHELVGLGVKVVESTDPSRTGIAGKIVDETRNTLVVETREGEKCVPKRECCFEFLLGSEKAVVEGKDIEEKPENRIKYWRKRHGM